MGKNEHKSTRRWFTCEDCHNKVFQTPHIREDRRLCDRCTYERDKREYVVPNA